MGAGDVEAAVVEAEVDSSSSPSRLRLQHPRQAERELNIRTCHQESGQGVIYIINTDEELIFVPSQLRVLGKIFSRHALHNETGTSPIVTKTQLT